MDITCMTSFLSCPGCRISGDSIHIGGPYRSLWMIGPARLSTYLLKHNKQFEINFLPCEQVVSLNLEPQFTIKEIEQLKQTSPSHLSSYLHQPLHLVFMPLLYTREASSILKVSLCFHFRLCKGVNYVWFENSLSTK